MNGVTWTSFVDANKRFCRGRLQPRLFPVGHMTALDCWFQNRVARVAAGSALLEFGCGRSFRLARLLEPRFTSRAATDLEDVPFSEVPVGVEFRRCTPEHIPYEDSRFDVVAIRSVIEHLDDPDVTFRELARVTRPAGRVLMNLPNKWDYVSVLARLAGPFKSSILRNVVRTGWEDFPVLYKCNTRRALYRCAARGGFVVDQFLPLPSQPYYLSFFVPFYVVGAVYQFAISLLGLDFLQPSFLVVLRKDSGAEATGS